MPSLDSDEHYGRVRIYLTLHHVHMLPGLKPERQPEEKPDVDGVKVHTARSSSDPVRVPGLSERLAQVFAAETLEGLHQFLVRSIRVTDHPAARPAR